jgi:ATP-dependent helicase HrpA
MFKVVIMSASIDSQRFCEYFGGCPNMHCLGINFPVEEIYKKPPEAWLEEGGLVSHATNILFEEIVIDAKDVPGDVLIFFSGAAAIDACVSKINARAEGNGDPVVAYPLYASADEASRKAATNPDHRCGLQNKARKGAKHEETRKVICTTNVSKP